LRHGTVKEELRSILWLQRLQLQIVRFQSSEGVLHLRSAVIQVVKNRETANKIITVGFPQSRYKPLYPLSPTPYDTPQIALQETPNRIKVEHVKKH